MNRIEFIAELEKLLQDIAAEERAEALQYYKDYFADAGIENEQHIIEELGSPAKVAKTIKAGLRGKGEESSEYRETGYTDTRFEEKEIPAARGTADYNSGDTGEKKQPWNTNIVKVFLIIAILVVGAPVILPLGIAVIAIIFALAVSGFAILGSFVLIAAILAVTGLVMAVSGLFQLFSFPPLGLVVCGTGLILLAIGLAATLLLVKLCMIVFPVLFRGIVNICRRPLHGKENKR